MKPLTVIDGAGRIVARLDLDAENARRARATCHNTLLGRLDMDEHETLAAWRRLTALLIAAADPATDQTYLYEHIAKVIACHGEQAARGWLAGYWYASGNRRAGNHATVCAIRDILGADGWPELASLRSES